MRLKLLFLIGLVSFFASLRGFASPRVENFFQSLKTEQVEVLDSKASVQINQLSSYPPRILTLRSRLSWTPKGSSTPDCDSTTLRKLLKDKGHSPATFKNYWDQCEISLRRFSPNLLEQFFNMLRLKYDIVGHPLARTVMFHLPEGIKVRGLLMLKGAKKRPLVIIRTGIFSSINEYMVESFATMQLFDEGPFHVLILPSLSGIQFIQDNTSYAFGGFEEALHNILVARILSDKTQPLAQYIDGIHLLGISMGANGVIVSNLLETKNRIDPNIPLFKKTLLICPLVNYISTERNHNTSLGKSFLFKLWSEKRLLPLAEKYPGFFDTNSFFPIAALVEKFKTNYREPLVGWNAVKGIEPFRDSSNLFADSQLWSKYLRDIKTQSPTLVIRTDTDPIVPMRDNLGMLENQFQNLAQISLPKGMHCSLPASHNWSAISQTLNFYFGDSTMPYELSWQMERTDRKPIEIADLNFHEDKIIVQQTSGPSLLIPRNAFDHDLLDLEINEPLKESLTRWLNRNLDQQSNLRLFRPVSSEE